MAGFGGAVKLTGESEYRKALKQITTNLKEVSSEMKVVTSTYSSNDKSVAALSAKQEVLTKKLSAQTNKLKTLKDQYSSMSSQYSKQTAEHDKLVTSYNAEKAKLEEIGRTLGTSSQEYKEQAAKVAEMEQAVKKSTTAQDANAASLSAMRVQINNAQADVNKTTKELDELDKELDETKSGLKDAGKEADGMDASLKDVKNSTGKADDGFTTMKGTLANLAAEGIKRCVDALKDLGQVALDSYQDFKSGMDNVIAKTGATGDALEDLKNSYTNVSKSVVADNEAIGDAIGEVNTRFGLTGDELEDVSAQFLKFADLNNTDVSDSIDSVQKAMSAFGVETEDVGAFLDTLNSVGQSTGISMEELSSSMVTNAASLQQMGFNAAEAATFLGQVETSGIDSSAVMTGLSKALVNSAADGKTLSESMEEIQESIAGATTEQEGINTAVELFGSKAGPKLYEAVKSGAISFDDFSASLQDANGNIDTTYATTQDAGDKIQLVIQGIKTDLATFVAEFLEKYGPQIEEAIQSAAEAAKDVFTFLEENGPIIVSVLAAITTGFITFKAAAAVGALITGFKTFFTAVQGGQTVMQALNIVMAANPAMLIVTAIAALTAGFIVLWNTSEDFRNFWLGLWETIKSAAQPVIDGLVSWFTTAWENIKAVWDVVTQFFSDIWTGIKNIFNAVGSWFGDKFKAAWKAVSDAFSGAKKFFSDIWDGIKNTFKSVGTWFSSKFQEAYNAVTSVFKSIGTFFSGIWDGIKTTFSALGTNIGDAIGGAVKSGINGVISMIENTVNSAIGLINGAIGLINKLPGVSVGEVSRLSLPRLARGGIVGSGQAFIAGEAGSEIVMPLEHNTKWMRGVARSMAEEITTGGGIPSQLTTQADYNATVRAFKDALSEMKVELDGDDMGRFIDRTVTRLVYN